MGNFSRTYPMVSFLRAVYSVTTLCFHPATGHTSHLSHTFSLQDHLKLRQKLISSLFSSFSIPLPVSQLMMCASYSPRPRSALCSASSDLFSLSLHWLSEVPPHPWLPQLSVTPKTLSWCHSNSAQEMRHLYAKVFNPASTGHSMF